MTLQLKTKRPLSKRLPVYWTEFDTKFIEHSDKIQETQSRLCS